MNLHFQVKVEIATTFSEFPGMYRWYKQIHCPKCPRVACVCNADGKLRAVKERLLPRGTEQGPQVTLMSAHRGPDQSPRA